MRSSTNQPLLTDQESLKKNRVKDISMPSQKPHAKLLHHKEVRVSALNTMVGCTIFSELLQIINLKYNKPVEYASSRSKIVKEINHFSIC